MKLGLFTIALAAAFVLGSTPTTAQDKAKDAKAAPAMKAEKGKAVQKVLLDNDKVRVFEVTFKPGDEGENIARPYRINRALKGGTLQRTYADGKTEKVEWKTGEVRAVGPDPAFTPKNIGKTEVVLYVMVLKQAK